MEQGPRLAAKASSGTLSDEAALQAAGATPADVLRLMAEAARLRDATWGRRLTYSPKVFVPVTNLCRNRCDYCAFRRSPGQQGEWTMSHAEIDSALATAAAQGCGEALLCLGDTPETAFRAYRQQLAGMGHLSTVAYLEWACQRALELGLLPHTNAGILSQADMRRLKPVNVSLGLMLENVSARFDKPGMPHYRAPDKRPERRLRMLEEAGQLQIPFTTGILIGIGETRRERVEALLAIRAVHERFGHIQEVIVQNFTAHPGTRMRNAAAPSDAEMGFSVAIARLVLPPEVSVQAPPNLNATRTALLLDAGINDFGGISPVTPDYINPEQPWPHVAALRELVRARGFELEARLPIYDAFCSKDGFLEPALTGAVSCARQRLLRAPRAPGSALQSPAQAAPSSHP